MSTIPLATVAQELNQDPDELVSPCIGVCTLGPMDLCIGCFRTSDEIGFWMSYSPVERKQIISELPNRLNALFAK